MAWQATLVKYHFEGEDPNDSQKAELMPDAQSTWKSLLQARHRLEERKKASEEEQQQESVVKESQ